MCSLYLTVGLDRPKPIDIHINVRVLVFLSVCSDVGAKDSSESNTAGDTAIASIETV